jgi:hypothetical protein
MKVSTIVVLVMILPTIYYRTGGNIDFTSGLFTPGDLYNASHEYVSSNYVNPTVGYIRILLAPVMWLQLPLTIVYWDKLKVGMKVLGIAAITGNAITWLAIGTNKGLADIALLVPWMFFIKYLYEGKPLNKEMLFKAMLIVVVLLVIMVTYFTFNMRDRAGSTSVPRRDSSANISVNDDNILIRNVPPSMQDAIIAITSYVTQGYWGLYLCLKEEFLPTYGVGNSMFLIPYAEKFVGKDIVKNRTYPVRTASDGWEAYMKWHSIYPWLASDFTFPGTIMVVFIIGRLFALCWLDVLGQQNPFAIGMFANFVIMLFYFTANNQCFQSGEAFVTTWVLFFLWITTRKIPSFNVVRQS